VKLVEPHLRFALRFTIATGAQAHPTESEGGRTQDDIDVSGSQQNNCHSLSLKTRGAGPFDPI
jgi:hypothetical protein